MLFKATPYLWSLENLTLDELSEIADVLAHNAIAVRPIFECVKVYVKLDENSTVRYARHQSDFLGVTKEDLVSRMKDPEIVEAVSEALSYIEETVPDVWPFRPGSATWCLLEILNPRIRIAGMENPTKIIVREAVRLDRKGNITKSPLLERMFNRMKFDVQQREDEIYVMDPVVYLRNTSGSGAYTEFKSNLIGIGALEGGTQLTIGELTKGTKAYLVEAIKQFADGLFLANAGTILNESIVTKDQQFYLESFPGINVVINDRSFRLCGSFLARKEQIQEENRAAKKRSFPPLFAWRS